jgi:phage tail-like protein
VAWSTCLRAGERNPDCLVQSGPGRYLWLRLTLRSNGRLAPAVRRLTVSVGRSGYLQYLPAVFQEDEESRRFLERFLAMFQSGFDDLNALVDTLGDLFDPHRTPAEHLPWVARWVGLLVDPEWSEAELRAQVAGAVRNYGRRGTADGLQASIRAYARIEARVVEHFRLRQLARLDAAAPLDGSAALWSPARTERLQLGSYSQLGQFRLTSRPEPAIEALEWGAHRFTVLFDAEPYSVAEVAARVARVVMREKPAHTEASICPVFPRMRLGVQARLDIDASVGDISYMVLSRLATLNYDTVLGCSAHEDALAAYGAVRNPRVGDTTRVA